MYIQHIVCTTHTTHYIHYIDKAYIVIEYSIYMRNRVYQDKDNMKQTNQYVRKSLYNKVINTLYSKVCLIVRLCSEKLNYAYSSYLICVL